MTEPGSDEVAEQGLVRGAIEAHVEVDEVGPAVAGDVAERTDDIRWSLDLLRRRFAKVIWVPGNHELWTTPSKLGGGELRGGAAGVHDAGRQHTRHGGEDAGDVPAGAV